jgi:hypothetical protein
MKKLQLLFLSYLVSHQLFAQQALNCPPDINLPIQQFCEQGRNISTNPSSPLNTECPQLKNNFDWRVQNAQNLAENYSVVGPNAQSFIIQNPFTGPADAFYRPFISQQLGSNYLPEDGWELLKMEFGTFGNRDNNSIPNWQPNMSNGRTPKLPYFILYNKYSGTMRFFGTLLEPDAVFKTVKIELRVPSRSPGNPETPGYINTYLDLSATNLLSIQGESIQPLDHQTSEAALTVFVPYTNNPSNFFWFDTPLAYDPCVCNNKVQLDVSFSFVQEADVDITGSLTGSIKTQSNSSNQDYVLMAFSRILGAGVAAGGALISNGAIVNYKAFTDLIDIFKDHPSLSADKKQDLQVLKNYASCSVDFLKMLKASSLDTDDQSEKKRVESGIKIVEGSVTFLNSLTKDCSSGDNSSTVISGTIKATGTVSTTIGVTGSRVLLALPGSKWNDIHLQSNNYISTSNKDIPSYPTYNERLGTLAMLETPTIDIEQLNYSHYYTDEDNNVFGPVAGKYVKIKLSDPLVYCFNPKLNIDLGNSKIDCRFLISKVTAFTQFTKDLTYSEAENHDNQFYSYNYRDMPIHDVFSASSNFLPIDIFKNQPMVFLTYPGSQPAGQFFDAELVYIQLRVFLQSNDVGSNGNKNSSILYLTFPVRKKTLVLKNYFSQIPVPSGLQMNVYQNQYMSNFTFYGNQSLSFLNEVTIGGDLKTADGVKVKIYSLVGFNTLPGATISPDIELVVGSMENPFPMPPTSIQSVSSFCGNTSKYKAASFSRIALQDEFQASLNNYGVYVSSRLSLSYPIPNPTNSKCQIAFDLPEPSGYEMHISNAMGVNVMQLETRDFASSGKHTVNFSTERLEAGVYYISFSSDGFRQARKLVVVK